jgi:hypothetical protein
MDAAFAPPEIVSMATRTLLAAAYVISGLHRQPTHIEFKCERVTRLGAVIQFLIAITEKSVFSPDEVADIAHAAANQNRAPVLVAQVGNNDQLSWKEFLDAMGGAVPAWRVLTQEFGQHLEAASKNELPAGMSGEPWRLFEDLVADGLEFCFGRRVNRLGAHKRGKKVSDMVAPLPDFNVIVIDAKATGTEFDASWPSLRALVEYVNKQKERQKGGGDVIGALVVTSKFQQEASALAGIAREFLGETRTPLCFMTADTMTYMINELRKRPDVRNALRWKMLFSGGPIQNVEIDREIQAADAERCEAREF